MSANGIDRKALEQLHAESMEEQVSYYRRPFMVLWAAVQESALDFGVMVSSFLCRCCG